MYRFCSSLTSSVSHLSQCTYPSNPILLILGKAKLGFALYPFNLKNQYLRHLNLVGHQWWLITRKCIPKTGTGKVSHC